MTTQLLAVRRSMGYIANKSNLRRSRHFGGGKARSVGETNSKSIRFSFTTAASGSVPLYVWL